MSKRTLDQFGAWLEGLTPAPPTRVEHDLPPAPTLEEALALSEAELAAEAEIAALADGSTDRPREAAADGAEPDVSEVELEEITDRILVVRAAPPSGSFAPPAIPRVQRHRVNLPLRGRTARTFSGHALDVSLTGMLFRAPGPFALGAQVRLHLALAADAIASVDGVITRLGRVEDSPAELAVGVRLNRCDERYTAFVEALATE